MEDECMMASKMCTNHLWIKLITAVRRINWKLVAESVNVVKRTRTTAICAKNWKKHVQSVQNVCVFFFKQKTAYEITTRLVGSEMCIRDSCTFLQSVYIITFMFSIFYYPEACFSKVPKLLGPISGATIPFISLQRRGSKPSNFAKSSCFFLTLKTC